LTCAELESVESAPWPATRGQRLVAVITLLGTIGLGIALLVTGGLLVSSGHDLAGLGLDVVGVLVMWSTVARRDRA
jgi:hypothetical protein